MQHNMKQSLLKYNFAQRVDRPGHPLVCARVVQARAVVYLVYKKQTAKVGDGNLFSVRANAYVRKKKFQNGLI